MAFLLAALPACRLAFLALQGRLIPDPAIALEHKLGWWAFVLLLLTLSITPLRRLTGWNGIIKYRKLLGNWCAAYAAMHVTVYLWLDQGFEWRYIWEDALEHKRIFLGLLAFLILLTLAATSPVFMVRKLGKRWTTIHRAVYVAVLLALVHFALTQKLDWREPVAWGGVVVVLLGWRVWVWARGRGQGAKGRTAESSAA